MTDYAVSRNPTTGEMIAQYPMQNDAGLLTAIGQSGKASREWRYSSMATRVKVLKQLAEQLRQRQDDLARWKWGNPPRRLALKWLNAPRFVTGMQKMARQCLLINPHRSRMHGKHSARWG